MHKIQDELLKLAQTHDLGAYSYRKLGDMLGDTHPFQVKHHLEQLIKNGALVRNERTGSIQPTGLNDRFEGLLSISIMGQANCGQALSFANNELQGFLRVSPSVVGSKFLDRIFALLAVGDSMNRANIHGSSIKDGDYVLVRKCDWSEVKNGDYVVSIFDGCANVKKLSIDYELQQVRLISESEEKIHPIIIANEDLELFELSGKVEQVIPS